MLTARIATCFGGCRLALRGLGRIASMGTLSVLASFIRAKTRAASSDVRPALLRVFFSWRRSGHQSARSRRPPLLKGRRRDARAHDSDSRLPAAHRQTLLGLEERHRDARWRDPVSRPSSKPEGEVRHLRGVRTPQINGSIRVRINVRYEFCRIADRSACVKAPDKFEMRW